MPHIDAEQRNAMLEKIKSVQNQPGKGWISAYPARYFALLRMTHTKHLPKHI